MFPNNRKPTASDALSSDLPTEQPQGKFPPAKKAAPFKKAAKKAAKKAPAKVAKKAAKKAGKAAKKSSKRPMFGR